MDREKVVIAEIVRPRGNRGELLVKSQTDVPGRIETLERATACLVDGSDVSIEIAAAWQHKELWVLKVAGVDSINDAERFRGADLWIASEDRGTLGIGDFFQSDLIGCSVIDGEGKRLGVVKGWHQYGGPPLMEVAVDGRDVLIPFVAQLCDTNLSTQTIQVDLPDGLLDL